jgi:RNA polymerase sigma-70 factor (ECF subfamily)
MSGRSLAEPSEARRALPSDADEFGRLLESHRRDIIVLCYRFLGSVHDAEDAAQETALKAWRGRDGFRGDAGIRTWLHRIATRVCLDAIEHRARRQMPSQLRRPADPTAPPDQPNTEILWLEPLPDAFLVDASLDPAARYSLGESVSLAFVAALQTLSTRQRAVLLLRDVLAWRASEVAELLGMTVSAANSALNRARTNLQAGAGGGQADALGGADSQAGDPARLVVAEPISAADKRLLEAYMRAWEADDVDALVTTLREEVRLAMPPSPSWYAGWAAVAELLRRWVLPMGPFRMHASGANLQPAAVLSAVGPDGQEQSLGVHVLGIDRGRIAVIDAFMDPRIAGLFEV